MRNMGATLDVSVYGEVDWCNSLDKNPLECWNERAAERLLPEQAAMLLDHAFWDHILGQSPPDVLIHT